MQTLLMAPFRDELLKRTDRLDHPAWGPEHCRRVWSLCLQILDAERLDADQDVLFAAVWIHDVGTFADFAKPGLTPPESAARAAERLLPEIGFPAEKTDRVVRIVREHSFSDEERDSVEARVLRDADMLDFLGVIGIVRLVSIVGLEEWVPTPGAAIEAALQFADELPDKMQYPSARSWAIGRASETRTTIEALSLETGGLTQL